jgi:hypothetical protein
MSEQLKSRGLRDLLERLRRRPRFAGKTKSPSLSRMLDTVPDIGDLTVFGAIPTAMRQLTIEGAEAPRPGSELLPDVFKIRVARSDKSHHSAGQLIERRYTWRGYETIGIKRDPNLYTLLAYEDGAVRGTLSVRIDSEHGLSADELYRSEIRKYRQAGIRVCEFTRLAIEPRSSSTVLGRLFHTAYLYAHLIRSCAFGLIEVNPRHAVFYRRGLFFEQIGAERVNKRVSAPSILLCVPFDRIALELRKYFADAERQSRKSTFAYWFPPNEAEGVLHRLQKLDL